MVFWLNLRQYLIHLEYLVMTAIFVICLNIFKFYSIILSILLSKNELISYFVDENNWKNLTAKMPSFRSPSTLCHC